MIAVRLLLTMLLALAAGMAPAQTGSDEGVPIEVEADHSMEWVEEQSIFVARGNAVATHGDMAVHGDTLTAHMRDAEDGGAGEIHRLEAMGNVVLRAPDRTAWGDHLLYDLERAMVVLRGKAPRLEAGGDVVTARDSLEYWEQERKAVARGKARATRADQQIEAEVLTARFRDGEDGQMQLDRVEARDNVTITTPQEVVRASTGVYDLSTGIIVLDGDVRITRGRDQLNGARAEVNMNTGVSRLLSDGTGGKRVRGLIRPARRASPDGG